MSRFRTFWQGLRFGMLLQIAVGPVAIFIFQTAAEQGFFTAGSGVLGVALIDAFYIFAAVSGVGTLLERKTKLRIALHRGGALILALYGCNMIWSAQQFNAASTITASAASAGIAFFQGAVLTLSSPLTIIFWIGVFAAELSQKNTAHSSILSFGSGAVCSTLCFLTIIAAAGSAAQFLLSPTWLRSLHLIAGLLLLAFGLMKLRGKS